MLRDRLAESPPPKAVLERLAEAIQPRAGLRKRRRAALQAALAKTAKRHPELREEIEARLASAT